MGRQERGASTLLWAARRSGRVLLELGERASYWNGAGLRQEGSGGEESVVVWRNGLGVSPFIGSGRRTGARHGHRPCLGCELCFCLEGCLVAIGGAGDPNGHGQGARRGVECDHGAGQAQVLDSDRGRLRARQGLGLWLGGVLARALRGFVPGRDGYAFGARERSGASGGCARWFGHGGGGGVRERPSSWAVAVDRGVR
jgi:hypothetical protein